MAEIRPQPQSPALGALARMLGAARDAAGRVRIDSQLLGQTSLADLLSLPGAASLAEDVSYFGPAAMLRPGSGRTLQTFKLDPRVLDAADVALNVSPLGALAAKGAARAARPVARAAGEAVNRAMLTGEGPLATALAPVAPRQLIVYHGTPHRFEPEEGAPLGRFRSEKIGTGEGAQVYGHGLYFAESPEVAKSYAVPRGVPDVEGMALRQGIETDRDMRVEIMRQAAADRDPLEAAKFLQYANIKARGLPKEKLAEVITEYRTSQQPAFYTVDLPDEAIARMLDWDKPLSEQPKEVREALTKIAQGDEQVMRQFRELGPNAPANQAYAALTQQAVRLKKYEGMRAGIPEAQAMPSLAYGQDVASRQLRDQSIPGIRYLDQGSRGNGSIFKQFKDKEEAESFAADVKARGGEGIVQPRPNGWVVVGEPPRTSNFVVFPGAEDMLTILERKAKGGPVRRYAEDVNKKPLTSGYYGVELRSNLYPGEDEFFRKNPTVAGMASDDNRVILNPYSTLSGREKEAVIMNEAARVHMRRNLDKPKFSLTPEQQARFANYSQNPDDVRATVAARILSGDPSAGKATPEQMEYVQRLRNLMVSEEQRLKHDERSKTVDDERQQGFIRGGMARRYAEGGAVHAAQYDPADIARRAASLMEEIDAA